MIDIHSHLLPGVDDGSPSIDVSLRVLERFASEGVTGVVCTPHLDASRAANAPFEHHATLLAELKARAPATIELHQGWEIMLDMPGVDLSSPTLRLGKSRAVLVEFTRGGVPRGGTAELKRLVHAGCTPVLAHPERYFGCTVELVEEWRRIGTVIQTDASVLMGRGAPAQIAWKLLAGGHIDILASDNHGDERTLGVARSWLLEHGADEQVDLLTTVNAQRLLGDEDPLPVPPLGIGGPLARIRRFFFS